MKQFVRVDSKEDAIEIEKKIGKKCEYLSYNSANIIIVESEEPLTVITSKEKLKFDLWDEDSKIFYEEMG